MVSVMYIWCVCMQHVYSTRKLASALDCNGNYGDDNSNHNNIVVNNSNVINLYFIFLCSEWRNIDSGARRAVKSTKAQGHN